MRTKCYLFAVVCVLAMSLSSCKRYAEISTSIGKQTSFGTTTVPIGGVTVSGTFVSAGAGAGGSNAPWSCTTLNSLTNLRANGTCDVDNVMSPANWETVWYWAQPCFNIAENPPGIIYPPQSLLYAVPAPNILGEEFVGNSCFVSVENDTVPADASPQVVLDSAYPSSIQIASFNAIPTAPSGTFLTVFDTNGNIDGPVAASTIASNGTSATFPFPQSSAGGALPSGGYLAMVSDQIGAAAAPVVYGVEPFFVAHNNTSYPDAFGVVAGNNSSTQTTCSITGGGTGRSGQCSGQATCSTTNNTQPDYPVVTLPTENEVLVGSTGTKVAVGTLPTAIVGYLANQAKDVKGACSFPLSTTGYFGPASALVVNTGSNSVSLIALNTAISGPTGTVSVGKTPVAAAALNDGTFAYVANWGDGTVSEVNLKTVAAGRVLAVVSHPSSIWYDATGGNLWVGGQGAIAQVSLSSWSVVKSFAVDGTVTSLMLDSASGLLYQTVLQNGSRTNPSSGKTMADAVVFNPTTGYSYATVATYNTASGAEVVQAPGPDNSVYSKSPLAATLPFPGQLAFIPPTQSSSTNGTFTAIASGTTYAVVQTSNGKTVVEGTMPSAIRSTAMGTGTLYLTLPDSNSVVSIPFTLP